MKTLVYLLATCTAGGLMSLEAAEFKNGTSFGLGNVPDGYRLVWSDDFDAEDSLSSNCCDDGVRPHRRN